MTQTNTCKQSISITGVILAGGLARRMGGCDKALLPLSDTTLIRHILDILEPQVDQIMINANRSHEQYEKLGYQVLCDSISGYVGPLAGMATAMQSVSTSHILVVPCDSPFLDAHIVERFVKTFESSEADICVAHDGDRLQPVFALLKTDLLSSLEEYLASDQRKIDRWYSQQNMAHVDFSDRKHMFININTPEDLKNAENRMIINKLPIPIMGFAAHSGSGKTTLLKKLIANLSEREIRIGLVKHAHHEFDIDIPGKDSYELRKAGATQVIVGSKKRWAHIVETPEKENNPGLASLIKHFVHKELDLILIEGFKLESIPKIEVFRPSLEKPRLSDNNPDYIAIASDETLSDDVQLPVLDLNNTEQIASFILEQISND